MLSEVSHELSVPHTQLLSEVFSSLEVVVLCREDSMFSDNLDERLALSVTRIAEIAENAEYADTLQTERKDAYADYFRRVASFILYVNSIKDKIQTGEYKALALDELVSVNNELYSDVTGENYVKSFANPAYAVEMLGDEYGQLLSFVYVEVRSLIVYAF
jgi:hypothetical protein